MEIFDNRKSIFEEIEEIRERGKVLAHTHLMLKLCKFKKLSTFDKFCKDNNLDTRLSFKAMREFKAMPQNNDRLFYLDCLKRDGMPKPPINGASNNWKLKLKTMKRINLFKVFTVVSKVLSVALVLDAMYLFSIGSIDLLPAIGTIAIAIVFIICINSIENS